MCHVQFGLSFITSRLLLLIRKELVALKVLWVFLSNWILVRLLLVIKLGTVGELKRQLKVEIPRLSNGHEEKVFINVEYLWEPLQCSFCKVFGHKLLVYEFAQVHMNQSNLNSFIIRISYNIF